MENNISYREIIASKGMYIATPVGTSMLPMIRQRIDTVKLVKVNSHCKKYDVILYQRRDLTYVLHRIVKVRENSYDLCGDNQCIIEKGVTDDMIIAKVDGFYRDEVFIENDNKKYIKYYKRRVRSRKYRYIIMLIKRILSKIKRAVLKK